MSDRPPDPFLPPTLASPLVPPPPPAPNTAPVTPPTRPNPFQPPTLASPMVPPTTTTPPPTPPPTPPSAPTPPTPGTTPISYRTPPGTPLSTLLGLPQRQPDYLGHLQLRTQDTDPGTNRLEALPQYFQDSGNRWGVPPAILKGVSGVETSFGMKISTSSAGAEGLMQFIPETARKYGVDVNNFQSSVDGAAHYLHDLYQQYGNWPQALQAYNGATNDPSMSYARKVMAYAGQNMPEQKYVFAAETPGLSYRGPSEWGRPPEGGYDPATLPTQQDIPAIMARIRQAYPALSGNDMVSQAAMMRAVDGYVQAQQQSQIVAAKMHAEQWRQNMQEFSDKLRVENMEIGEAMAANEDDTDGMSEALSKIVNKYDDHALQQAMAHGPDAVNRLMQVRDHLGTDASKTSAALEREQQDLADRKSAQEQAQRDTDAWAQSFATERGRPPTPDELKTAKFDFTNKRMNEVMGTKTGADPTLGKPKTGNYTWTDSQGKQHGPTEATLVPGKGLVDANGKAIDADPESIRGVSASGAAGISKDYSNVPETWTGAPNKPPPGTDISQSIWDAAVQLAITGDMPKGYGQRNVAQTQQVLDAAPLARRVFGITAADEWKQQSRIAAAKVAETAVDRFFASGQGAQQMNRMNTVASHLDQFREYADALNNNEVVRANQIKNRLSVEFGNVEVPDFEMAKTLMADEVVRLLTQTGGTRWDRADAQERVNSSLSGKQLGAVADTLQNFVRAKFDSLQAEYVNLPGRTMTPQEQTERTGQFGQMLLPEAKRILSSPEVPVGRSGGAQQPAPAQGPPLPDWGTRSGNDPDNGNALVIQGKDGKLYNPDHTPYMPKQAAQ